jgi:hypothetical protein
MSQDFVALAALSIRKSFDESFASLQLLLAQGHVQSFLVVLYSTIDAAAWLAADHDRDVTRSDFVKWAETYMLPESGLDCSALDLYGARCGMLHSFSAYSSLQRKGDARPLSYAIGSGSLHALQSFIAESDEKEIVAVQLETLASAVVRGWERFLGSLDENPRAIQRLVVRGGMLFSLTAHQAAPSSQDGHPRANG